MSDVKLEAGLREQIDSLKTQLREVRAERDALFEDVKKFAQCQPSY